MPRLEKYVSRDGHYVLTNIGGSVITYQLTPNGASKLTAAGVEAGQNFERALLLDLYRTGDAYAQGNEFPEAVVANQLQLDFATDPSPESAFPVCDECGGLTDLHLTLSGGGADLSARLLCPACRAKPTNPADTSIPLSLLSRPLLGRLTEIKAVGSRSANVVRYEALLETAFVLRWEAVRKQRTPGQSLLFSDGELGGLGLG